VSETQAIAKASISFRFFGLWAYRSVKQACNSTLHLRICDV